MRSDPTPNTDDNSRESQESRETALIRRRYDRVAPVYDALEWFLEWSSFATWREDLWRRVEGEAVLEVGVGTGKNVPYYPADLDITALDISPEMLERARQRADEYGVDVELIEGDAQALPFEDNRFDSAVTTFVFCSVPDPNKGLSELRRVLKPGGQLLMLEHVLSQKPVLRTLMRWLDFLPYHIWGAHIDRQTTSSVKQAGFAEVDVTHLFLDIVERIEARCPKQIDG